MESADVRRQQVMRRLREQKSLVKSPPATERAKEYVRKLLETKVIADEMIHAALSMEVSEMTAYRASQVIGLLKQLPYKRRTNWSKTNGTTGGE